MSSGRSGVSREGCAPELKVWRDGALSPDRVAEEVPVALLYNGEPHVVMMCTPADLEDFARGFSVTEDIVRDVREIDRIVVSELPEAAGVTVSERSEVRADTGRSGASRPPLLSQDTVSAPSAFEIDVRIPAARAEQLSGRQRNLQGRTGCGLCGAQTIAAAIRPPSRVSAGTNVPLSAIRRALEGLRRQQPLNAATGATHAAAWASPDGLILATREDVGRHNALDKLIGHLLEAGADFTRGFLLITSRASYEMVQKAAAVGIPIVVAISAPTAYAVRIAEEAGLTLIGFARGDRQVIYTCPARIPGAGSA